MANERVYSYLRFSDPKQAAGSSVARQLDYAQQWAASRGMVLDTSLTMRDDGLSAYHQAHVTRGALGVFLAAIDEGRIAAGSVLVVEGLDRLSRAEPIQAQAQLAQIINAGITVVTASDGREYNRAGLKAQPMDLVYSLLVMIRAHEESDTKSKRVRAAIRRQCEGWLAGTYRGPIRNGKDPAWVRWDGARWALVPDRAAAMQLAVEMFRHGEGGTRIVRALARQGVETTGPNLYKQFRLPALVGLKRIVVDGETFDLPDYYPALLSREAFDELQRLLGKRGRRRGRGEIPGIITGMGITFCGYCGAAMVAQNLMSRRKDDGTLVDGHRRLICCGTAHGSGCTVGGSCSAAPVERAVLSYCSDQINLSALLEGGDHGQALRAKLAGVRQRAAVAEAQLERITTALLSDDEAPPLAFVRKARELESAIAEARAEAEDVERELAQVARHDTPALSERWAALADAAASLDADARTHVRQLVADTFERLVIYHRGTQPDESDGRSIDVMLFARGGGWKVLRVDRRGGAWSAGVDGEVRGGAILKPAGS